MKLWKSKGCHSPDQRRIVTKRRVSCGACGEQSHHFEADWHGDIGLFTVPYVALNGGIGEETEGAFKLGARDQEGAWLSGCCHAPRARP